MNKEIQYVSPFKKLCITVGNLPTAYIESMSYYEGLTFLVNYLSNNVIPALNNNGEAVKELQDKYVELKQYLNDYFENLDVQEEINNKLDEMAESGQLTDIIAQYLGLAGVLAFNTVNDMKSATNLVNGSTTKTLGFTNLNDGGGASYKIRTITNSDIIDESTIIALNNPSLIAELLNTNGMSPIQFGCIGDGTTDDTTKFQIALNNSNDIELGNKTYLISSTLTFNNNCKINGNGENSIIRSVINNGDPIFFNNQLVSHFLFNNFYIDATDKNSIGFKITNPYDNCIIQNIYFDNFTNKCLDLGRPDRISQTLLINNCCVYMSRTPKLNTPIFYLEKCYESNILNNKLLNRAENINQAPCLYLNNVYDNNIQGNSFSYSSNCGIYMTGSDCRHNRIISNTYEQLSGDYAIKLDGTVTDGIQHTMILEAFTYYSAPDSIYCNNESNGYFVGMRCTGGRRNMIFNVNDLNVQSPYGNCSVTSDNGALTTKSYGIAGYNGVKKYTIKTNDSASADYGLELINDSDNKKLVVDFASNYFGSDKNGFRLKLKSPNGTTKYLGLNDNGEIQLYNYPN